MEKNGSSGLTRVLIADELTLLREGMAVILEATGKYQVVAQCSDGQEALQQITDLQPAIAILDFNLGKLFALEIMRRVREQGLSTRIVIISNRSDKKSMTEAVRAGVNAFLPKVAPSYQLLEALVQVETTDRPYVAPSMGETSENGNGEMEFSDAFTTLSPREFQVFTLMVEGVRAKEIAVRLRLSPKTVDTYRSNLMRKLDIHDLAGLVKFAIARELTSTH